MFALQPWHIDLIIGFIGLVFVILGMRAGGVRAIGSLISLIVSILVGIFGIMALEEWTGMDLTSNPIILVLVFVLLSVITSKLAQLIINAMDLVRRAMSIIPFVNLANSLAGGVVGIFKTLLLIALIAYVSVYWLPATAEYRKAILQSQTISFGVDSLDGIKVF
ncbi:CvpA family protein [Patescibacteria group bacterium]|nr:CvpA family protein [Patescibacteria group bacterium]